MTDDTGLLEHALGRIPRRKEGYTTDDNARALWTVTEWLSSEEPLSDRDRDKLSQLADVYMAFLLWSQQEDGWWHNNVAYDRKPEPERRSHDCQGRAFWACADAWVRLADTHRNTAQVMVLRALPTLHGIDSHRGQAFTMAACAHLLEANEHGAIALPAGWHEELTGHLRQLEQLLNDAFRNFADPNWRWYEPAMTYSNGIVPWAMLRAYRWTGRADTLRNGLESLRFLLRIMTAEEGWMRPVGNESWCTAETISRWDQQPLETFKLALALKEAMLAVDAAERGCAPRFAACEDEGAALAEVLSILEDAPGRVRLLELRRRCLDWFHGDNDLRAPMADPSDGSCCDGLMAAGPNINCGAEATLSYLMTEALCRR